MKDHELNAAIAQWMNKGAVHSVLMSPDYLHDSAAALRVLARINESLSLRFKSYLLEYNTFCGLPWIIWCRDYNQYMIIIKAKTPCIAICTAWETEFGDKIWVIGS